MESGSLTGSRFARPKRAFMIVAFLSLASFGYAQNNPSTSVPQVHADALIYSDAWTRDSEPVYANFRSWTEQYLAKPPSTALSESALISTGVRLAHERRLALGTLIQLDPRRALGLTVPAFIRQALPSAVLQELETRVSGIGDFSVIAALPKQNGPPVTPVQRVVELDGQRYRAFVFGRRINQTTKIGIPLHGIAIDGVLALGESSIRRLEADEKPNPGKRPVDLTSAPQSNSSGETVLGEVGSTLYRFTSREQLLEAEAQLEEAESGLGPCPKHPAATLLDPVQDARRTSDAVQPDGGWTTGNQNVLIIRIDFSDLAGDPNDGFGKVYTASYIQNFSDTVIKPYFVASSYGLTTITNTTTTQVYRLPHPTSYYTHQAFPLGSIELHTDSRNLASADYVLSNYDRIIVLFSDLANLPGSNITFGGLGDVGGPRVWVNAAYLFGVVAHELGHTYGLYHAGLWQVSDGNPISPGGHTVEYGDDFDTMGVNPKNDLRNDYNPWYKNIIGWISNAQTQTITTSGIYRVNRFDNALSSGILALKVTKDSNRTYWIGCRRSFTENPSMQHGAYIVWGYNMVTSNSKSALLDMTTPGNNVRDAALAIGSTFTDTAAQLSFTPVAEGGAGANQYIDVQVTFLAATPTPIPSSLSISGAISYCSNPVPGPVTNVTLTLTGTGTGSVLSDSSGSYLLSPLVSGGSYMATPAKAALTIGGAGAGINTVDVVTTQRHFLQISILSGCRLAAADVNGDGNVTTVDVIATQRFFLGFTAGIANVGQYKFTPANRNYLGIASSQINQNYNALVFGDVASPFVE